MGKLTSKQANELANNFLAVAQSIRDYRIKNYDSLTKNQNLKLRQLHKKTLDYSDDLFTTSATLFMEDAENSLLKLNAITKKIKKSYKSLRDVQKAIDIATNVVVLGASIFSLSPPAIIDSIGNLKDAIEG